MAVAPCPTNCTPDDLLGLLTPNCNTGFRRTTPSRIFLRNCDIDLPTGSQSAIDAAMLALFNAGSIVSTMELANVVFEDPTYEELQLNDCSPAQQLIATRALTFEDRNAIDISGVSPYVANLYYDYDLWANWLSNQNRIRFMLAYCNGDVKSIEFVGTMRAFIDYIKPQTAGGKSTETKKVRLLFNGDPIGFDVKPFFNYITAGIDL
jgi:hypothetical protein